MRRSAGCWSRTTPRRTWASRVGYESPSQFSRDYARLSAPRRRGGTTDAGGAGRGIDGGVVATPSRREISCAAQDRSLGGSSPIDWAIGLHLCPANASKGPRAGPDVGDDPVLGLATHGNKTRRTGPRLEPHPGDDPVII